MSFNLESDLFYVSGISEEKSILNSGVMVGGGCVAGCYPSTSIMIYNRKGSEGRGESGEAFSTAASCMQGFIEVVILMFANRAQGVNEQVDGYKTPCSR